MIKVYGIIQKFTDQSISADFYRDRSVKTELTTTELIKDFLDMVTYGVKSKYYQNSFTLDAVGLEDHLVNEKAECVGGCTL
jgi:ribonucleoside-diphosphate reductase alpha chain